VTTEATPEAAPAVDDVRAEIADLAAHALDGPPGDAWRRLVEAGVVALAVPERSGGHGLGVGDAFAVLAEVGRRAAAVPALATVALGVLPLARFGRPEQQDDALRPVAADGAVLTAALHEPSRPLAATPRTVVRSTAGGWALTGVKTHVPYADRAHRILVPAVVEDGPVDVAVILVDPAAPGVTITPAPASGDAGLCRVALDGAEVDEGALLMGGPAALADLHRLAVAAAAVTADGLLAGALALTTEHVRTREQFGRPLATFQAVAQHLADVYVTSRAVHLVARAACDAIGDPRAEPAGDAHADSEVAAAWVTGEVRQAIGTCHHLHGGLGLDRSYPLHRYSETATDLAHLLGGDEHAVDALADRLFGGRADDGGGRP
jgi:alkylation response protein AidB-like acyl-CoA dehydrogenase